MSDQAATDRLSHHGTRITELEERVATLEDVLILHLRCGHGMTETNVASTLGISRSHVRKVVHR